MCFKILFKKKKTIIVPTYSFTNKGKFYQSTPTNLSFSKWILKQKMVMRLAIQSFQLR